MSKVKLLKKCLKMIKQGRMTIQKMKELDPKLIMQMLIDKVIKAATKVLYPFLGKVVLGCLIIGIILVVLYALLALFMWLAGFFGAIWDGIKYVFGGTSTQVDAEAIEDVRKELDEMGVDFQEIGFIGAIYHMGSIESVNEYNVTNSIKNKVVDEIKDYHRLLEEIEKAEEENNSDKKKELEEDIGEKVDKYTKKYIEKFLEIQEELGSAHNGLTFASDKGSIKIKVTKHGKEKASFWDKVGNFFTGSYEMKEEDGKFYVHMDGHKINVTQEVLQTYMPWKYPFAFWNSTMSPDVGYLVATLGRHNYIDIVMDTTVSFRMEVHWHEVTINEGTENEYKEWQIKKISGQQWYERPEKSHTYPLIGRANTWYSRYDYNYKYIGPYNYTDTGLIHYEWTRDDDYQKTRLTDASKDRFEDVIKIASNKKSVLCDGGKISNGKNGWIIYEKSDNVDYYRIDFNLKGDNSQVEIKEVQNSVGQGEMDKILLPLPEYENGKVKNESELPKYYTANGGRKDESSGTYEYTGERAILNVATNADTIVQTIDDIFKQIDVDPDNQAEQDKFKGQLAGDQTTDGDPNKDYMTEEDFAEIQSNSAPFEPNMEIKMVADIVKYFDERGLINIAQYFSNADAVNYDIVWFLDDDGTSTVSGDKPVKITNIPADTVVYAPTSGQVTKITESGSNKTVHITQYCTYEVAQKIGLDVTGYDITDYKIPILEVVISGFSEISTLTGSKVTGGQSIIGKADGKLEFRYLYQAEEKSGKNLVKTAKDMETAELRMPIPMTSGYRLSSSYGYREDPVYGGQAFHNGIDLAATAGTEIYAVADGTVSLKKYNAGGYGNYIIIDHANNKQSLYGHMLTPAVVNVGDTVKKGQLIGYIGSTGKSTGPHLHFTLMVNGSHKNPTDYITLYNKSNY